MAQTITNTSSMLFDFLKSRFELNQTTDANGKPTVESSEIKVFGFDFVTSQGDNLGNIVVSLLDDGESTDSVKVYFGKDVADTVGASKTSFNKFLQDLRQFGKSHMLGFDVRDINRSGMTQKDQSNMFEEKTAVNLANGIVAAQILLKNNGYVKKGKFFIHPNGQKIQIRNKQAGRSHVYIYAWTPKGQRSFNGLQNLKSFLKSQHGVVNESAFGPMDGTSRTSKQPLEGLKLVIKHSDKINPEIRGSRSRRISKIYLANNQGERFLLPFVSLSAARAMAQHVRAGGTPYDETARRIVSAVDEGTALKAFLKKLRKTGASASSVSQMLTTVAERLNEIKNKLAKMRTSRGYTNHKNSLSPAELTESNYVERALTMKKQLAETTEFEQWANKFLGENSLNERPPQQPVSSQSNLPTNTDLTNVDQSADLKNTNEKVDSPDSLDSLEPQLQFDVTFKNSKGGHYQKKITAENKSAAKKSAVKFARANNSTPLKITACEDSDNDHAQDDEIDSDNSIKENKRAISKRFKLVENVELEIVRALQSLWQGIAHDFYASYAHGLDSNGPTSQAGRETLGDVFTNYYPKLASQWQSLSYEQKMSLLRQALPDGEVEASNPAPPMVDHGRTNLDSVHSHNAEDDEDDEAWWAEHYAKRAAKQQADNEASQKQTGDAKKLNPNTGELFDSSYTVDPRTGDLLVDSSSWR